MSTTTARRYFGTDGIRGIAGETPMSASFAFDVGMATAEVLRAATDAERLYCVIGRDTRLSGSLLTHAVSAGLAARGADVYDVGIMPTPGVAYLTRALGAHVGVVISASHNPFDHNGIKLFSRSGEKLADALELKIEARLGALGDLSPVTGHDIGTVSRYDRQQETYPDFLRAHAPDLSGLSIGLDCANGANYQLAPDLFRAAGANVSVIHAEPDGVNINTECGSTYPDAIRDFVRAHNLDVGLTFDGDADRVLMVDKKGRLVDGDHMLAMSALYRGETAVVSTVMSNLGTERYLAERGVTLLRSKVGDRYVFELLRSHGLTLGGEPSGHLLFLDLAPTGDGMLSALRVLAAVQASDKPLGAWLDEIPRYPQTLLNVPVPPSVKSLVAEHEDVLRAIHRAEAELAERGRVNVRPSGTEALVRVMVEAEDEALVDTTAQKIAAVITRVM